MKKAILQLMVATMALSANAYHQMIVDLSSVKGGDDNEKIFKVG